MSDLFELSSLADAPKWKGATSPISLAFPSEADLRQNKKLTDFLQSCDIFESYTELQHREKVVKNLESVYKEWLRDTCLQMNMPEYVTDQVGGRVVPFGSFLLGVHTRCSDIDVLCVGPGFIERHTFFSSFSEKLRSLKEVQDIRVIEEAFVPVISLTFDGIQIDLVFARVMQKSISDRLYLLDTKLLQNMDVQSVRSLQGYRVTKEILNLVPNVYNFRVALRAIKHWAKCRNIYSNKLGFLGGVAWCILVARVCQLYPNASAATLVAKFFLVFSMWEWPIPILLRHPEAYNYNFPVWDLRVNPSDHFHCMPIITPTYPQQNSAYNVTPSTLTVMMDEIKRGRGIPEAAYENRASWRKLFDQPTFVQDYRHYIVLRATAATETQQQVWADFVESKLRLLVGILERNANISLAHPSVQSFPGKDGLSTKWLIGVQFNQNGPKKLNLTPDLLTFSQTVYSQSGSIYKDGMEISAAYETRNSLRSLLSGVNILNVEQPTPVNKMDNAPAKKRAFSPGNERHSKKFRVQPTSGEKTTPNKESVVASSSLYERRVSSKRQRTPEADPEAKKIKQELCPSRADFPSRTPAQTRPVAKKRHFRGPFFRPVQRRN